MSHIEYFKYEQKNTSNKCSKSNVQSFFFIKLVCIIVGNKTAYPVNNIRKEETEKANYQSEDYKIRNARVTQWF